jgi:hypothetical protein
LMLLSEVMTKIDCGLLYVLVFRLSCYILSRGSLPRRYRLSPLSKLHA